MTRAMLLHILFLLIAGCAAFSPMGPTMLLKPSKPVLVVQDHPTDPQGICLDARNTSDLMFYIHALEDMSGGK